MLTRTGPDTDLILAYLPSHLCLPFLLLLWCHSSHCTWEGEWLQLPPLLTSPTSTLQLSGAFVRFFFLGCNLQPGLSLCNWQNCVRLCSVFAHSPLALPHLHHTSQHRPTHKQAMEEIQPQAPARPAWMTDSVDALLSFCNQKTPGDNEKDGVGSEGLRGVERLRDTRLAWFHIPQLTHPHPPLMFRGLGMMRMSLMRLPQACTTRERTR